MSKILYIELFTEQIQADSTVPTGRVRRIVSSGKCAVFDEKEFDELIQKTQKRLRELKRLREQAEEHRTMISEESLKTYGVPFTVKELVKKQC